ncbi:MAG: hypothetical protein WD992_01710 [Candidatus Levyibacteriota bacterium]
MVNTELARLLPDGRGLSGDPVPPTISLRDLFESTEPGVAKTAMFLANATSTPLSGRKRGFVQHYQGFDVSAIVRPIEEAVPGLHAVVTFSDGDRGRMLASLGQTSRAVSVLETSSVSTSTDSTIIMTSREALAIGESDSIESIRARTVLRTAGTRTALRTATLLVINGVHFGLTTRSTDPSNSKSVLKKILDLFPNADVIGFTAREGVEDRLKAELGVKIDTIKFTQGGIFSPKELKRGFNYGSINKKGSKRRK